MRAINVEELKSGMRIARSIYDEAGRVLLSAGILLNSLYITKLTAMGIPFVYIEDEFVGPLDVEPIIKDEVKLQTVKVVKDVVKSASVQNKVDITPVSNMVNEIMDEIKGTSKVLFQLVEPSKADAFLYSHSVGVCVLSILTGKELGLDELKLKTLGMGAILHDIGKSIDQGPEHTTKGFELLRENRALSVLIAHTAFQHHERFDGTGYPRQIKGEEIHLNAAITCICNDYYNLVNHPDKRLRIYPHQALEKILAEGGKAYNSDILGAFSTNIAPYPVGATIRLNNGAIGVVIEVTREFPTRPVIKIITDEKGILKKDFPELDLSKDFGLCITEVISEQERRKLAKINPA